MPASRSRIQFDARSRLASLALALVTAGPSVAQTATAANAPADLARIRAELQAVNDAWSQARLRYDTAAYEKLLAPGFYAALRDRRLSRAEFIAAVSARGPGARLVRFDNPILAVIKGQQPGDWAAVVIEKIETERTAADGTSGRSYSLWVTRDGYRQVAGGWQLLSTEEVGHESWAVGSKPPFPDW